VQEQLLEAIAATGTPVVLVLMNGHPLILEWAADHVPAIAETWFLGVEAGNAIADVLFGDANPSGKLPVTIRARSARYRCTTIIATPVGLTKRITSTRRNTSTYR